MKSSIFSKFRDFVNIKQPFSSTNYRLSGGFLGGIKYLLFDDFLTPLAAGSVDGTNAEPTGGARDVTDTDTVLPISGGNFIFAPHSVTTGWGNFLLVYPNDPIIREAGRFLLFKLNHVTNNGYFHMGLSDNAAVALGNDPTFAFYQATGNVYNGSFYKYSSNIGTGTKIYAILLRAAGCYAFVKNTGDVWRLVAVLSSPSAATVYPHFSMNDSGTINMDWVKIPENLYLPAPVVSTSFPTSAATIEDQGSNGYNLSAQRICLTGTHGRWERYGDTSRIPISSSYTHAVLPHAEMSVALQFRKRSFYTRGTLFRIDKADGSYLTLHTNQYGDWQISNNRPSGFSNVGMPSKTSITNGDWHGVAVTVSDTEDEAASYFDGVQQGTQNTIGTGTTQNWNTSFGIGVGGSGVWPGDIRNVVITLNGTVMTQAQAEALSDPDTVITTTLLDGYFGAGNYAYYPLSDAGLSDGLGHAETSGLGAGGNGVTITNLVVDGGNAFTRIIPALSSSSDVLSGDGTMEGAYDDESGGGGGTVDVPQIGLPIT